MSSRQYPSRICARVALVLATAPLAHAPPLHAQYAYPDLTSSTSAMSPAYLNGPADGPAAYTPYGTYTPPEPIFISPGTEMLERENNLPRGAFGEQFAEPSSSDLNLTGTTFNGISNPGAPTQLSGGSSEGIRIPFLVRAPEPPEADIKAGPLFIKFHSIQGLVLYDSNPDYFPSQAGQQHSNFQVLLRLDLTIIAQLTNDLQLSVSGDVDYFPLDNYVGFESANFFGPAMAAQLAYSTVIAGWPVIFQDKFNVGTAYYFGNLSNNFNLFDESTLTADNNGNYFLDNLSPSSRYASAENNSFVYYSNLISAQTYRDLPDDTRLTLGVDQLNLWYNQQNRGLPKTRDDFLASLASTRPDFRFKPYLSYEATDISPGAGFYQIVRAGLSGPIDDQLFFRGEVGYYTGGHGGGGGGLLFNFNLDHLAGPFTSEHLSFYRDLDYFDQVQFTGAYYRIDQILGPTLGASLFVDGSYDQDIANDGGSNYALYQSGVQLSWLADRTTAISLGAIFQAYDDSTHGGNQNSITGRFTISHVLSDSLTCQLLYQYTDAFSGNAGYNFRQNVLLLQIVKLLP